MNLMYFHCAPSTYISFANSQTSDDMTLVWHVLDQNSNWFKSWLVIKS